MTHSVWTTLLAYNADNLFFLLFGLNNHNSCLLVKLVWRKIFGEYVYVSVYRAKNVSTGTTKSESDIERERKRGADRFTWRVSQDTFIYILLYLFWVYVSHECFKIHISRMCRNVINRKHNIIKNYVFFSHLTFSHIFFLHIFLLKFCQKQDWRFS
jgi:hypothetical protein